MSIHLPPMPALTVYQPHASLIACEAKLYETRSWATKYRGPIAIHAGLRLPKWLRGFVDWALVHAIQNALFADCKHVDLWSNIVQLLPRGCIIATAELVGCWPIKRQPLNNTNAGGPIVIYTNRENGSFYEHVSAQEQLFGDFTPGRFAWELANVQMLGTPIPAKGHQRIWMWEGVA